MEKSKTVTKTLKINLWDLLRLAVWDGSTVEEDIVNAVMDELGELRPTHDVRIETKKPVELKVTYEVGWGQE